MREGYIFLQTPDITPKEKEVVSHVEIRNRRNEIGFAFVYFVLVADSITLPILKDVTLEASKVNGVLVKKEGREREGGIVCAMKRHSSKREANLQNCVKSFRKLSR